MLESRLATISTLLDVMGMQVEPSSPERQLVKKPNTVFPNWVLDLLKRSRWNIINQRDL
jgi:hypothetical protein